MTIRYDEYGNPYDDGEFDYSYEDNAQPQNEIAPVVVVQNDVNSDDGYIPVQDSPVVSSNLGGSITDDFSGTSSIPMSFDLPDQSLVTDTSDYYSNEPIDLGEYDYGFGNDYLAEPVAPSSGETTVSTSNFENARRTPLRGEQDGSVRTPVRDFLFGRKGRFSEQPSVYTEPTPSVTLVSDSSPTSIDSVNPLTGQDIGSYDYLSGLQEPSKDLASYNLKPALQEIPSSLGEYNYISDLQTPSINSILVDTQPSTETPISIAAPVSDYATFAVGQSKTSEDKKDKANKNAMMISGAGGVSPSSELVADTQAAAPSVVPSVTPASQVAQASTAIAPVNPFAPAESVEQRIRREMQAQFAKDNQQRKDLNLIEQSRVAVPLGEKGIPDSEVQAAKNRVSAYYAEQNAKKEKEIDDEIKANQERQILDAIEAEKNKNKKPDNAGKALPVAPLPVAPAPVPKSSNAAQVDRPQSKGTFKVSDESPERMEGKTFFVKGPNGLTPEFIPLASNVLDKETAEKNINKLQQLKQDELNKASPSGDLLKSQLRKEVALKKLGDDSLKRIYDYVTEVNKSITSNSHSDTATGSSKQNSFSTEGASSVTRKNEFGSSTSSSGYKEGSSSEVNQKESSGKSRTEAVGNSQRTNSSDNRMNVISLSDKIEQSIADTILNRAAEARRQVSEKYDPDIQRFTNRYNQLNSQADSNSTRETLLGDLTGAGKAYPSLAFSASSPQPASHIDHFTKRFDTTDPVLKREMDDISVKIGLLNRGDEAVMKDVPVNELSNPKIKNILDGNFNNKIISNIIKGSNPDVEFEMAKGLHFGERILREQSIGGPKDSNDPVSVALNQAQLKAAGTNTDFGQAVLAAKVLKAHNDLTNMFTMPSPNPADAKDPSKRVLVPFNKFIENVYQNVSADPSKNALLGAVAVELANKFPAYKQELNNLENARRSYIFSDPEKEALSNMVRFLADPVNGKYYQSKIKGYNFNKFNQQSLPLQPTMLGH